MKEAKCWMRSGEGKNEHMMFINEQPEGGFEWTFIDYEPTDEDKKNYEPIYINDHSVEAELKAVKENLALAVFSAEVLSVSISIMYSALKSGESWSVHLENTMKSVNTARAALAHLGSKE